MAIKSFLNELKFDKKSINNFLKVSDKYVKVKIVDVESIRVRKHNDIKNMFLKND